MSYLLPPPEQKAFERELSEIFPHGDQTTFACYVGQKSTYVSQMLNFDHSRESIPYRFLRWLWGADSMHTNKGDAMLGMILRERGNWLPSAPVAAVETKNLTKNIGVQFSEFIDSELNNLPIDQQIKECDDIVKAAQKKLDCLRQQKALGFMASR